MPLPSVVIHAQLCHRLRFPPASLLPELMCIPHVTLPDACAYGFSEMNALQGHMTGDWVETSEGDETFAIIPAGTGTFSGSYISFVFTNCEETVVQFAISAHARDGSSDSFLMKVDDGSELTWHYPNQQDFAWQTFATTFTVAAGEHTLYVHHREDDTGFLAVKIVEGQATFSALLASLACECTL